MSPIAPKRRILSGAAALWLALASSGPVIAADEPNTIVVKSFMFAPMDLKVKAGAKVTPTFP